MPVIKSAKKKLRKDRKRTAHNLGMKNALKAFIKTAKLSKKEADIIKAVQAIDKAAKNRIIHNNKANRLKSLLSKLTSGKKTTAKPIEKEVKKAPKKVVKKTTKKTPKPSLKLRPAGKK